MWVLATNLKTADVSDTPGLARLAEEVQQSGTPLVLQRDGQDLAILMPLRSESHGTGIVVAPLTEAERDRALAMLERARVRGEAILAARGGVPLAESWPIINEERDQRSEELG